MNSRGTCSANSGKQVGKQTRLFRRRHAMPDSGRHKSSHFIADSCLRTVNPYSRYISEIHRYNGRVNTEKRKKEKWSNGHFVKLNTCHKQYQVIYVNKLQQVIFLMFFIKSTNKKNTETLSGKFHQSLSTSVVLSFTTGIKICMTKSKEACLNGRYQ